MFEYGWPQRYNTAARSQGSGTEQRQSALRVKGPRLIHRLYPGVWTRSVDKDGIGRAAAVTERSA